MAITEQDLQSNLDENGEIDWDAERQQTAEEDTRPPIEILAELAEMDNIAPSLDEDTLSRIGATVVEEYNIDVSSRADWTAQNERAMKLAKQVAQCSSTVTLSSPSISRPISLCASALPRCITGHLTRQSPHRSQASTSKKSFSCIISPSISSISFNR